MNAHKFFHGLALLGLMLVLNRAALAAEHTKDTLETVRQRIEAGKAVLVDVREQAEWDEGHLEGAVLVPLSQLKERAESTDYAAQLAELVKKDRIVYCHCRAGRRALTAADLLKKLGYDVRPLKQGYQQLIEAGFPKAVPAAK